MDELISNLEHCLSIFEAPTVASTEHNLYFIKSSIGQFVIPYLNRKGIPNGMDILSLDNKYLVLLIFLRLLFLLKYLIFIFDINFFFFNSKFKC